MHTQQVVSHLLAREKGSGLCDYLTPDIMIWGHIEHKKKCLDFCCTVTHAVAIMLTKLQPFLSCNQQLVNMQGRAHCHKLVHISQRWDSG